MRWIRRIKRQRRTRRVRRTRRLGMIRRRIDNTTTKNNDHKMHQNSKNEKQSMAVVASRIQVQNVCLVHLSHMGSHQSHSHIESHHPSEARNGPNPGLWFRSSLPLPALDLRTGVWSWRSCEVTNCLSLKYLLVVKDSIRKENKSTSPVFLHRVFGRERFIQCIWWSKGERHLVVFLQGYFVHFFHFGRGHLRLRGYFADKSVA